MSVLICGRTASHLDYSTQVVIVNRLVLNLRQVSQDSYCDSKPTLVVSSFLGNIGAALQGPGDHEGISPELDELDELTCGFKANRHIAIIGLSPLLVSRVHLVFD